MLNNYDFQSAFKDELNYFIKYKRSLGLKYEKEISRLKYIDNIFHSSKLKSKKITKDIFHKLTERNNMQGENYARQYGVTKDFCKFLISNEYKNIYYEDKKFNIVNNYKPTIFNDEEINLLFKTMDEYKNKYKDKKYYKLYYSYSILFRLLYACGLRVSEVVKITIDNINFSENTINIIDSKRHISRLVVFSNSMKRCLKDYSKLFDNKEGLLFLNNNDNIINTKSLRKYYKKILDVCGLNTNSHVHDFRHLFCNKALNQMLEKGYDENVVIVYLYKYMGHKTIAETEYYLHFTDYNKKKLIDTNDTFSKRLYEGINLDD
ncbi:MAG: tyrosine-type recombinase/integrase [Bacilli bacterium]|nr:tyrosine-type recombinase/integrase [Bacilli bacterium]